MKAFKRILFWLMVAILVTSFVVVIVGLVKTLITQQSKNLWLEFAIIPLILSGAIIQILIPPRG